MYPHIQTKEERERERERRGEKIRIKLALDLLLLFLVTILMEWTSEQQPAAHHTSACEPPLPYLV